MHLLGILELGKLRRDVLRYIDEDGSGPSGLCDIESFFDDARNLGGVPQEVIVLRARSSNADDIRLLEGVVADKGRIHLTGEYDDGHRVHIGGCNACHRIGGPRAGRRKGYADARGGARVTVRGVDGSLLVPYQHLFYIRVIEGVGDVEDGAPGIAEKRVDSFHF